MSDAPMVTPQLVLDTLLQSRVPVAVFAWRNEPGWPLEFVSPNVKIVLGYEASDFFSGQLQYAQIIHHDDLSRVFEEVQHFSASGVSAFEHEDYRIVDPHGCVRWVQDHTTIVRDAQGQITHYFGYILDVTSRAEATAQLHAARHEAEQRTRRLEHEQRARQAAHAANAAKSQFLATMSHELRTPLNAILGYTALIEEMVEDDELRPDALLDDLCRIRRAGQHLLALVNDVLDLSRVESGRMPLHLELVVLEELLEEVLTQSEPLADRQGNSLRLEDQTRGLRVKTDRAKLRQILLNLLSNAAKFTHRGAITLRASLQDDPEALLLQVQDTGIGISPQDQHRIFEAFVQADSSHTRRYEGTGLGLALSARLASLLGASLRVESAPGEGSCFEVLLPLANGQGPDELPRGSEPESHEELTL